MFAVLVVMLYTYTNSIVPLILNTSVFLYFGGFLKKDKTVVPL